jgi:hypothetical protein
MTSSELIEKNYIGTSQNNYKLRSKKVRIGMIGLILKMKYD